MVSPQHNVLGAIHARYRGGGGWPRRAKLLQLNKGGCVNAKTGDPKSRKFSKHNKMDAPVEKK